LIYYTVMWRDIAPKQYTTTCRWTNAAVSLC